MPRKYAVTIAAVTVVLAAALVVSVGFDVNRYRGTVQAALSDRLGRDVSLGPMHVSLFPPGVRVEKAAIADDPTFRTGRAFAQVDELYVSPRLFPLLRGRFELRALVLRRPLIELVRNAAGAWNYATLGRGEEGGGLVLDRLTIVQGEVAVVDRSRGAQTRLVYRNIDLQVQGFTPGRAFDVALAVTLPNHGAQRLAVRGNAGPLGRDDLATTPFDGVLEFDRVSLSGLQQFLQARSLEGADAVISGSADLRNRGGQLSAKGVLRFEEPRARGASLGYPVNARFELTHDSATDILTIRSATLQLDKTPLSIDGTIDLHADTAVLDLRVAASDVALTEAARLASALGVAFGADTRADGRLNASVRARGPANRPALDGQLQLRNVSISGKDIPRPVHTPAVDLSLTPGEIRSNDFSATTNGTSLDVRFALKEYTTPKPIVDATIRTPGADLAEVLTVARAWGVHAVDDVKGTGRLTLDVHAAGALDSPVYSGRGSLDNATLQVPALAQPVQVRRAGLTFSGEGALAENLNIIIGKTTADGRLGVRNLAAPQVSFDLTADKIDVADIQGVFAPGRKPTVPARQGGSGESLFARTTGSGRLRAGAITYGQLILDSVQTDIALDRGLIRLDPLTSGLYGGRQRGSVAIDTRRTPSYVTVASTLEQVDANRLASAVAGMRDAIYGTLAAVAHVTFAMDGAENITRTLNGTLAFKIPNGRIANMDLMYQIASIGQFVAGQRTASPSTSVTAMSGSFKVSDGVASTNDLTASIEGGRVGAAGTINLVNQALNLRTTAVLARGFTQLAGITQVGGLMGTVLANQRGELVIPMLVTGTVQHPQFAPDVQRMAEMKLRNLTPSLNDPQQLATGILGVLGDQQPGGTSGQKALDEILGVITGRGAQPPGQPSEQAGQARGKKPPSTSKPQPKDPTQQLQDALRKLMGGDKQKPKKPPK